MDSGIYLITNLVNNKVYVGSASIIKSRWKCHKWTLRKNKHHNIHLQRAWNFYGEDNFKFEVLESVEILNLENRENYWMQYYKNLDYKLYNISPNAEHSMLMPETKLKISRKNKGRPAHNKGIPCSTETKLKISNANIGHKHSLDQIEKIRLANVGKVHSKESIEKRTKILLTDLQLNDIYKMRISGYSLVELADAYNMNRESIRIQLNRYIKVNNLSVISNRNSERAITKMLESKPKKDPKIIEVKKPRFESRQLDYIIRLFINGTTSQDIGDLFNCSRATIAREICKYKGVKNLNGFKKETTS